jgi:cytochrome c biogenesis protein
LSKQEEKGFFPALWDSFSSLRLTIALLIILAFTSIFGTVIPQNASPEEYLRAYKFSTYKILKILGFLDMYHAKWFLLLLALLSLNLAACSWRRFRITWKFFSNPAEQLGEDQWKSMSLSRNFSQKASPQQCLAQFPETLSRLFSRPKISEISPSFHLFAEKGKYSRLGVFFIHMSILVIMAGALIGSFYGYRGNVNVVEGQAADRIFIKSGQEVRLPEFRVKLEKFSVSFYPTGAPKEFKSDLTILEGSRKVLSESIRVNHPLTYKGISFYQSSYGVAGVEKVMLAIKDRETQKEALVPATMGTRIEIPGGSSAFSLVNFIPDFQGMGPALQVMQFDPNRPAGNFWVLQKHPQLSENPAARYQFTIREIEPKYYSGLQVTKDPGVWVVWTGCIAMVVGFYMTFFVSHRRVWLKLTPEGNKTLVTIAGSSRRNQPAFEREFDRIEGALKDKSNFSQEKSAESEGKI